ncbi:MAG: 16S rRNA (cytosine(1402)-N(4))-methyltransferase RsmH [Planctomycetota bacterium]|nr:MAG: 16S rRNA (cytosine(1402)-N(4))-methyltransferase RsmH [Planctomycetota bacterium]
MSELDSSDPRPPRRARYRGTHPRRFEERYKELDPARFPREVEKVRARGHTPAGTHVPVLLAEVLEVLRPAPGGVILDCTLGHGGHAAALAQRVLPGGRAIGIDADAEELERTRARLAAQGLPVAAHQGNFAGALQVLAAEGLEVVDIVLADLGVSSMQLDRPERGFSWKHDGPLDMRMDRARGVSAAEWLRSASEEQLRAALESWGEDPDAAAVAAVIKAQPPASTGELLRLILQAKRLDPGAVKRRRRGDGHPAARTFQALRMAVNREIPNLEHLLRILPRLLRPGGRAAILSFHSGEDRRVKQAFARGRAAGVYAAGGGPVPPSPAEVAANPRARSARLRWAERA